MSRILIVDDEKTMRSVLQKTLLRMGYDVVGAAATGLEAFQCAKALHPDLILMDIVMPGEMDGIDAAKKIRAELDIPVIFLTGYASEAVIDRAKCAEPYGYIVKPYDEEELQAAIELALHKKSREGLLNDTMLCYRNLTESIPTVFWLFSRDYSQILHVSPSYEHLWRRACNVLYQNPLDFLNSIHPDDRRDVLEDMERRKSGRICEIYYRIIHPDGDVRWIRDCAYPVKDDEGSFLRIAGIAEDVTIRRRMEAVLRESEQKFRIVADYAVDWELWLDPEGRFIYNSPSCERITGYAPEAFMNDPDLFSRIVHPEDRPYFEQHKREADRQKLPGEAEYRIISKEGSVRWLSHACQPVYDRNDRFLGIRASNRDVTSRKHMESALKEREEMFSVAFHRSPVLMTISNIDDGTYIDVNDKFVEVSGFSRNEAIGRTSVELGWISVENRKRLIDMLGVQQRMEELELELTGKNGAPIHCFCLAERIILNGRPQLLSIAYDITDRKRIGEELKRSAEAISDLYHHAPCGYHSLGPDGTFLNVNETELRWLGYERDELIGKKKWIDILTPESRLVFQEKFPVFKEIGRISDLEYDLIRKDGSILPVILNATAIKDADGRYIMSRSTIFDNTTRKAMEAELRQAQKMEAIGTLASGIAHDFNNILASMIGYTELTMELLDNELLRENLSQVLEGCDRAKKLVKQILTFSRRTEKEKRPVDLRMIVNETIKLLRPSLPVFIDIRQTLGEKPANIMADPTEIHQIIMNLSTNASHAMREKGGILHFDISRRPIEKRDKHLFSGTESSDYVKLTISDTGHGIEPAIMEKIFDPFFTTKSSIEGTGLGLSVVYGIVKSHHGAIHVESKPGAGTVFSIDLPLLQDNYPPDQITDSVVPGGTERVLFVDDEQAIVAYSEKILGYLGYQVKGTAIPEEALEIFRMHPDQFDLVITDMAMPKMTGDMLARSLLDIRPDIPIIICSGFSEKMSEERAREIGIHKYLMKPLKRRELALAIREVLDG